MAAKGSKGGGKSGVSMKVSFGKKGTGKAKKSFNKHDRKEKNYRGQGGRRWLTETSVEGSKITYILWMRLMPMVLGILSFYPNQSHISVGLQYDPWNSNILYNQ